MVHRGVTSVYLVRIAFISKEVPHPAIWVLPITHFEFMLLGIVIGLGGFDRPLRRLRPLLVGFIGLLFFILLLFLPDLSKVSHWLFVSYTAVGITTSMILFAVLKSAFLKRVFSVHLFVYLGKRSYGLYVYYLLGNGVAAFMITKLEFLPSSMLASFLYALIFTVIISILSYKVIETPFLKLKKRFEVISSRPI